MKEIGYELWDRKIPMTPDHAELVLKEYAKFHAVSLAMREKRPVHFEELTKDLGNVFQDAPPEKSLKMIMSAVEGGLEAVKGNQVATEALERYALVAEKFWLEDMKNLDEPLVVLHGDCWCNNFLFKNEVFYNLLKIIVSDRLCEIALGALPCVCRKLQVAQNEHPQPENRILKIARYSYVSTINRYTKFVLAHFKDQDSNKPTKLCVIDWQLCSKGSPVQDLAYFLFTCCPKEILTDYRKYLKIYHDCVCQNLKNFNCDPEEILPFSSLERLWQKYAKFGIHMALMIIKLMLGETGEVPNFAEIVDSGKDIMTGLNIEIRRSDDYSRRISDILSVSSENDLI
ncbi:hypothetical protein NQ317_007400 [Molorchus minor]|uniref:CHK kinase-like domain-containing protein n=1 Tax=Molorchus minor TaxID=1323400 RepID=A0ABQ9JUT3_9CUCU|nr:hypothetical protein NQ317_007400 [Molorchus minor]